MVPTPKVLEGYHQHIDVKTEGRYWAYPQQHKENAWMVMTQAFFVAVRFGRGTR